MEGKGWFIVYGVLALVVIYLFIAQQSLNANVRQLQADVSQLKAPTVTDEPQPEQTESPAPEATGAADLTTAEGRDAQRRADLVAINAALREYQADRGSYPDTLQALVPDFLTDVPKDPLSPKFNYRYQKTSSGFRLTFYVEDPNNPEDQKSDGKQDRIFTVTERTR